MQRPKHYFDLRNKPKIFILKRQHDSFHAAFILVQKAVPDLLLNQTLTCHFGSFVNS